MIKKGQKEGFWDVCNVLLIHLDGGHMSVFTLGKKHLYLWGFFVV